MKVVKKTPCLMKIMCYMNLYVSRSQLCSGVLAFNFRKITIARTT